MGKPRVPFRNTGSPSETPGPLPKHRAPEICTGFPPPSPPHWSALLHGVEWTADPFRTLIVLHDSKQAGPHQF
jgi:hypothetical protein